MHSTSDLPEPGAPSNPEPERAPAVPYLAAQLLQMKEPPAMDGAADEVDDLEGPPSVEMLQGKTDRLRILCYVGRGGMGFVYEAEQEEPRRRVAVKLLRKGFGESGLIHFQKETEALARIAHPSIVACHWAGITENGWPYFVMEWVEGHDLEFMLKKRKEEGAKGLLIAEVLDFVLQTTGPLGTAHAQGFIHRDIKPANLLLNSQGQIKILDFGLALASDAEGRFMASTVGFSYDYAAPEQRETDGRMDQRTDIYGLGATFYHLLTGELPGPNLLLPSELVGVDQAVDDLLKRMLHADMERRPRSMEALAQELIELQTGERAERSFQVAAVLRGPGDKTSQDLEAMVSQVIASSVDAQRLEGNDGFIRVACATEGGGAALGLRWLRLDSQCRNSAGLAQVAPDGDVDSALKAAGRLATLALPGQFLVARPAFERLVAQGLRDPRDPLGRLARFHRHGQYTWPYNPGSNERVAEYVGQICPAGDWGRDPFQPPQNPAGGKPSLEDEDDWHVGSPLVAGEPVPHCPGWILSQKLGRGGYGEVWLAAHPDEAYPRAFKFCYDAARLESFRREGEILRYLARCFPDETGFSRLLGDQLVAAPFSLQTEFCPQRNLAYWLEAHGGAAAVPLVERLRLLARVARLTALAHDALVIHRDLKPANILIIRGPDPGTFLPRLADFGLSGMDESRGQAVPGGPDLTDPQSRILDAATRMYGPHERTSTKSDVYALGVILFQLYTGRFDVAPGEGWKDQVDDPLLREDITIAIHQDPEQRCGAQQFAERLETWEARREERLEEQTKSEAEEAVRRRTAQRWRVTRATLSILAFSAAVLLILLFKARAERESAMRKMLLAEKEVSIKEAQREREETQRKEEVARQREIAQAEAKERSENYIRTLKAAFPDLLSQSTGIDVFWEQARQAILDYEVSKANTDKPLDGQELRQLSRRFQMGSGIFMSFTSKERIALEALYNETGLEVNLQGLQISPGEIFFARGAFVHAIRAAELLPVDTDPARLPLRMAAYLRGLEPARTLARHAAADQSDFSDAVKVLRRLATISEKLARKEDAKRFWEEMETVAKKGAQVIGPQAYYTDLLKQEAEEAAEKLRRLNLPVRPMP